MTSMKIDGVLHEFSSLRRVREDVTDMVLNVKQIALKMEGEGPRRLHLSATGPTEVTAGMIATTGDIEVTNPDLVICHVDEGATLNIELTADIGKGYQPAVGQPSCRRSDRTDSGRRSLQPGSSGRLQGRKYPRRSGTRLRQAHANDRNRRNGEPGGRARLRRSHSSGSVAAVRPLRREVRSEWPRRQ